MPANHPDYRADVLRIADLDLPWRQLQNQGILITGGTGSICSLLVDVLLARNERQQEQIAIHITGRDEQRAQIRFGNALKQKRLSFIQQDLAQPLTVNAAFDYIIHGASNADPLTFASDPVGTMNVNISGTRDLLELARRHQTRRFLYISSGEVYGEATHRDPAFTENDYGYVDILNPRACYPSAKRAAETLCACYLKQYSTAVAIARPCHTYGPTLTGTDSRAHAQFIRKAVARQDIVLKSAGLQLRSYCHVADVVSGILHILFLGNSGQAYNVANPYSNVTIRDFAETAATIAGTKVRHETPDIAEQSGYSKITRAILDSSKLQALGWNPKIDLPTGLRKTIEILSDPV
jgi:nucleoside-diphosphate-sugar epimerase